VGAADQHTSCAQANNTVWNTRKHDEIVTRRRLYTTVASADRTDNIILMIYANRLTKQHWIYVQYIDQLMYLIKYNKFMFIISTN
jgi:hypothetical protein